MDRKRTGNQFKFRKMNLGEVLIVCFEVDYFDILIKSEDFLFFFYFFTLIRKWPAVEIINTWDIFSLKMMIDHFRNKIQIMRHSGFRFSISMNQLWINSVVKNCLDTVTPTFYQQNARRNYFWAIFDRNRSFLEIPWVLSSRRWKFLRWKCWISVE